MLESKIIQTVCQGAWKLGVNTTGLLVADALFHDDRNMTALAARAHISPAAMTGIIDRLQKEGFVTREDHTDRRSVIARLTPKGREIVQEVHASLRNLTSRPPDALLQA
jgi:DNA-binding MarR family transcriptional regulator